MNRNNPLFNWKYLEKGKYIRSVTNYKTYLLNISYHKNDLFIKRAWNVRDLFKFDPMSSEVVKSFSVESFRLNFEITTEFSAQIKGNASLQIR